MVKATEHLEQPIRAERHVALVSVLTNHVKAFSMKDFSSSSRLSHGVSETMSIPLTSFHLQQYHNVSPTTLRRKGTRR